MKLSVVSTLYRSAPYLREFVSRATLAANAVAGDDYEIVLVNDGSPDDSLEVAVSLGSVDRHIVIIDLSRNFGHHKAMMTGLIRARGNRVFLVDSDLEEEPEWLSLFARAMDARGCDVVYGVQHARKGPAFERWTGWAFYRLFRVLSGLDLPNNVIVARLMSRRYVGALVQHVETEIFMAGLWVITGFDQIGIPVQKHSTSPTTYTLRKKVAQFVNSLTAFSTAPLNAIFVIGIGISCVSAIYAAYLVVNWLLLARPPEGYTSLIVSLWLLGGIIIAFIGVQGLYLAKIYSESKRRPYTIIRGVFSESRWHVDESR